MDNALMLAKVAGPLYLGFGLMMFLYMKPWQHFLGKIEEDHFRAFSLEFVFAVLGMVVVGMYNVWEWNVWLLVTLTGWWMLVESFVYFLLPGSTFKQFVALKKQTNMVVVCGLVCLAAGAVLTYYSYLV